MLKVIEGDILNVKTGIILHQTNCQGGFGAGLAGAIADKWPHVKKEYVDHVRRERTIHGDRASDNLLGTVQLVAARSWEQSGHKGDDKYMIPTDDGLTIGNVFAQDRWGTDKRQTNYGALGHALSSIDYVHELGQIYVPWGMGSGLAGGDFEIYSEIIEYWVPEAIVVRLPQ